MDTQAQSRYVNTDTIVAPTGPTWLSPRSPFRYTQRADTIVHSVTGGETLSHVAARYYATIAAEPARLWWVIADFQPEPIIDPTLALSPAELLYVPHPSYVQATIAPGIRTPADDIG